MITDGEGVAELGELADGRFFVDLLRDGEGLLVGAEIDASSGEAELVLDGKASLELLVVSHGLPRPGATGLFLDQAGEISVTRRRADSSGLLTWNRLTPGAYRVRVTAPDHWTEEIEARAGEGRSPTPVALRRLGDLRIRLISEEGVPLAGVALELTDRTTGASVADWLERGLVEGGSERTDAAGELFLSRLPEGEYRVRVAGPGGVELGVVEVVGGGESVVELR
ncbi:MAG TPA: carboxypeptidase regulatory-like domain-containing protein [Planctomycetes bacterium]|nr:carboxypeptidase regulatory-like domain-containing protein [Planctomycetota bacterium]